MVLEAPDATHEIVGGFLVPLESGNFLDQAPLGQGKFFEPAIESLGRPIDAFVQPPALGRHT